MRVSVQENIHIIRGMIRRNVLQSKFQASSHEIDDKRPLEIGVAISAHIGDGRSDGPQLVKNRFGADVAKMPDLIPFLGHFAHAIREPIVCIGENEDA